MSIELTDVLTRQKYTELKFNHQIQKAHRKGKLVEIARYPKEGEPERFLVDPALVLFNIEMFQANVLDAVNHTETTLKMVLQRTANRNPDDISVVYKLNDSDNGLEKEISGIINKSKVVDLFQTITDADPTPNKEYVQWILTMYTRVLKDREPKTSFDSEENKMGGFAFLFFENLEKLKDALSIFHKIKNTKLLSQEHKDIYTYRSVDHFVETVFKAQVVAPTEGSTADNTVNVLTGREMAEIKAGRAHLLYQDDDWIIVHTPTKDANIVFGENTTWCTAGTRWGGMFDSYNKQGKLFVLIKNEVGASSHVKSFPEKRLQFHFESDQFMNALDKKVDILKFFRDNYGVKNYFREYIIGTVLKKSTKMEDMMKVLKRFGMIQELIEILRGMKIKVLDLSGVIGKGSEFELSELGTITTLVELTMRECELEEVPEAIRPLRNLKILRLTGNKIKKIPSWINEFKSLEQLNIMKNDIQEPFDVSGLTNLNTLNFGFNKHLKSLPTGLEKLQKLETIDFCLCSITEIPPELLECKALMQINAIRNRSLTKVPEAIVNLPKLLFLGLDETGIPVDKIEHLKKIKANVLTTIV